jgi:hypothetical protein
MPIYQDPMNTRSDPGQLIKILYNLGMPSTKVLNFGHWPKRGGVNEPRPGPSSISCPNLLKSVKPLKFWGVPFENYKTIRICKQTSGFYR